MSEKKHKAGDNLCQFAPDQKEASKDDEILYRKTRSLEELNDSSDRCLKHVSEHLDRIEEEILSGSKTKKTD